MENRGIGEAAESVWERISPVPALSDPKPSRESTMMTAEVETLAPLPLAAEATPSCHLLDAADLPSSSSREGDEATQLSLF